MLKSNNKFIRRYSWCFGLVLGVCILLPGIARADDLQPLIDAVTKQIADNQAVVNQKQAEADTLQNRLTAVQADLAAARSNLELTKLRVKQIAQDQQNTRKELDYQTELLRQSIASAYKQGNVTPMEVLASSDNLSELVSKQEYYSSLRTKISSNLNRIKNVNKQLDDLKTQLKIKAEQEKLEQVAIAEKEAQLQILVAQTRGEEGAYRQLVEADRLKLSTLRAQQAAAIAASSVGRDFALTSEYPWASVEPFPSYGVDPWGFYYRQCTSYAAWRRANLGRPIPAWGFLGPANAKQWPGWAQKFGMRVDNQPEVGALGVYPAGEYGHVMVVEAIVANGEQVLVSEFNADWGGRYSQSLWPSSVLQFIH